MFPRLARSPRAPPTAASLSPPVRFIPRNIFFKFPDDGHNLYGGETFAMKSASHESRGIRAYLETEVRYRYTDPLTRQIHTNRHRQTQNRLTNTLTSLALINSRSDPGSARAADDVHRLQGPPPDRLLGATHRLQHAHLRLR